MGTRVIVVDKGNQLGDILQNYSDQYGRGVTTARGRGEFVGDSPTTQESQRKYAQIIADYQKGHPEAGSYTPPERPSPHYHGGGFAPASGFYSGLEKTLEEKMPERASAEQVRALLRGRGFHRLVRQHAKWPGQSSRARGESRVPQRPSRTAHPSVPRVGSTACSLNR
jgi:hypothetical protein